MLKKLLAVTLVFALLGQNALFAQQISPAELASLRDAANQDIQEMQLTQTQKTLLTIGGTAFATSLVWAAIHRHIVNIEHKKAENTLKYAVAGKEAQLQHAQKVAAEEKAKYLAKIETLESQMKYMHRLNQQEIEDLKIALAQAKKEYQLLNVKKEGLAKSAATQKAKKEAAQRQIDHLNFMIEQHQETLKMYEETLNRYTFIESDIAKSMQKYEKLFDATVSDADRKALKAALSQEPWLKAATEQQQKAFLATIDNTSELMRCGPYNQGASTILTNAAKQVLPATEKALYQRLIALSRHLLNKTNVTAVGLIALFGLSANYAQAQNSQQTIANRINTNFDLFLNASDEDLKEIANNKEAVKVCIQGAYAIHMMKALPKSEIENMTKALQGGAVEKNKQTYDALRKAATY